jgi:hypothetical protein
MRRCRGRAGWLLALGLATLTAGCRHAPSRRAGTGAEEVARAYYEAVLHRDWVEAYGRLDRGSRARHGREAFAQLAARYVGRLGFAPQKVQVGSCEEHGDEAIAHVVLAGTSGGKRRSFKDAIVLKKEGEGWGVALPPRFGNGD